MLSGFENETAVFYVEREVATEEDAYGEQVPVTEWVPLTLSADEYDYVDGEVTYDQADVDEAEVRSEQRDAEYVRNTYGEWPMEVYRLYVSPRDVGTVTDGSYELAISADDRVELGSVDGRFTMQPPELRRLDSTAPEYIQLEVTRVGV